MKPETPFLALFSAVLLVLGTQACSSDSSAADDDDDSCAVEVTYSDKDGNAEESTTKICKDVPSACGSEVECSDDACDEALGKLCESGSTKNACGVISFGSATSVSVNCQRDP